MSGKDVVFDDFEGILDWVCCMVVMIYYFIGICKMGIDDKVVVDFCFKVKGIEGLCVVDVLIMLIIVSGNINVLCIMIGEKVVDFVLEDVRV